MKRIRIILAVFMLGLVAQLLYVPHLKVVRVHRVVPVRHPGSSLVSMGHTAELLEVRKEPMGYHWVWSADSEEGAWFGSEVEYRINGWRLMLQIAVWGLVGALVLRRRVADRHRPGATEVAADGTPDTSHSHGAR